MLPEGSFPLPDPRVLEGSREFASSDFPTRRVWMTLSVTSFLLHSLPISKQADRCPVYQYQLLTPTAEAEEEKDVTVISWSSHVLQLTDIGHFPRPYRCLQKQAKWRLLALLGL